MTLHLVFEKAHVPSTRIRLQQMAPHLEREGIPCEVRAYPHTAAERRRFSETLAVGDVVVFHRIRPGRRDARWWRSLTATRVYDFDDAVWWGRGRGWQAALAHRRRGAGFRRALANVHGVTAGNAFLADRAAPLPRRVVPSAVELDVPRHIVRPNPQPLRIGWVGRASNWRYVEAIGGSLARVAAQHPVELVCVSERRPTLRDVPLRWIAWSRDGEAAAIATFDVGIMPLDPDEPWSLGKCGYKLLQCMAAGVPVVASSVGANRGLIRDGENGQLVGDGAAWVRALLRLAGDPALRARLGAAGRASAEPFGYATVATALADFLRELSPSMASR